MRLMNERTRQPIADLVEVADTRKTRRRGLLGRDRLEDNAAMMLVPCAAVHTAFMRFPIDVAFIDRDGQVLRIVRDLAPWRIAIAPRAHAVVEFAGGCLNGRDVQVGDHLYLAPTLAGESGAWSDRSVNLRMTTSKPATSGL